MNNKDTLGKNTNSCSDNDKAETSENNIKKAEQGAKLPMLINIINESWHNTITNNKDTTGTTNIATQNDKSQEKVKKKLIQKIVNQEKNQMRK